MENSNQTQSPNFFSGSFPSGQQNQGPVMGNKGHWVLVGVVIILLAGFLTIWYYVRQTKFNFGMGKNQSLSPDKQEAREDVVINNEIEKVDIGDLDKEFNAIDSDLNGL